MPAASGRASTGVPRSNASEYVTGDAGGGASAAQAARLRPLASVADPWTSPHEHVPRQVTHALPEAFPHSLFVHLMVLSPTPVPSW